MPMLAFARAQSSRQHLPYARHPPAHSCRPPYLHFPAWPFQACIGHRNVDFSDCYWRFGDTIPRKQRAAEGISPVVLPRRVFVLKGWGEQEVCMPSTRAQHFVFSILIAFAMVYGMELYNQALMAGGLATELFLVPFGDMVPLMAAVIVLEALVGGKVAHHCTFKFLRGRRGSHCSSPYSSVFSPAGLCAP